MKVLLKSILLAVAVLSTAPAQEIDLTLEVSMENLSLAQRSYLEEQKESAQDFRSKIIAYVNQYRWTNIDFRNDKIPVTMSINFTQGSDAGEFQAQVAIASQRRIWENGLPTQAGSLILRILDSKWSFTYIKGTPLYHDDYTFNEIASFIDFYMYIIIGTDFDSYEKMQGTPYYQKALTIAQRAISDRRGTEWQGNSGQYSRMNYIGELLNSQYDGFREALYWYYYEGLDFMKTEQEDAQAAVCKALELIADIQQRSNRSLLMNLWLEAKSNEFCSLLQSSTRKAKIMALMAQSDPARSENYRKCGS
jgi:hypothetical protein